MRFIKHVKYNLVQFSLVFLFCGIIIPNSFAQSWSLYKSSTADDIKIFYRELPLETSPVEFKGETHIKAKLSSLVAVIRDVESMHEWVYQVKSAEPVEIVSDTERYTYIVHNSPFWGFDERDSIVHSCVLQNPTNLEVLFKGKAAPFKRNREENYVRIISGMSNWKFIPKDSGWVKVIFEGHANPGGVVEKMAYPFLLKKFLWKLPFESLRNLKAQVKKSKYQNAKYSFIKDVEP